MPRHYTNHPLEGLAERRILSRTSATALAALIGLETPSYRRLERGERRCYLDKAFILAQALGCTVEQLGIIPDAEERLRLFKQAEERATKTTETAPNRSIDLPQTSVISAADEIANAAALEASIREEVSHAPEPSNGLTVTDTAEPELSTLDDLIAAFDDEDDDEENSLVVLRQQGVTSDMEVDDENAEATTPERTGLDKYTSVWAGQ